MAEEQNEDRQCTVASVALMDVLVEECGGGDELIAELADLMGVPKSMISEDGSCTAGCHSILREGLDDDMTTRETNAYVVCRAHDLLSTGDAENMREAINSAWDEV